MKSIIAEKMDLIFRDFENNLKKRNNYCELKDFDFSKGHTPDYNNELMQQMYLLRYLPSYFFEYYTIYKKILKSNFLGNRSNMQINIFNNCFPIKVLSIGCGCAIDLWGLASAVEDLDESVEIYYTGIDKVKWNYFDDCGLDSSFINKDIKELNTLDNGRYNIIIFPKSIGELDDIAFRNLRCVFENSSFIRSKIILVSSVRYSYSNCDMERFNNLISIFANKKGYKVKEATTTHYNKKENGYDYRLQDLEKDICYPDEIFEYMSKINESCPVYIEKRINKCKFDCDGIINRRPITTTSQIKYQIAKLERE